MVSFRKLFGLNIGKRQWVAGSILFVLYLGIMLISDFQLNNPALFFPASGIALGALFLEGAELWPFLFVASLIGTIAGGFPILFILVMPVAQTLQAVVGLYILRLSKLDPLFRGSRDFFILFMAVVIASFIVPTAATGVNFIQLALTHTSYPLPLWHYRYGSTMFSLLVITPFILRWFEKPKFNRTPLEIVEILGIFSVLIALDILIFIEQVQVGFGISLIYILFIPLFWIALRLRPRFVTLALLITSSLAIAGLLMQTPVTTLGFNEQLFQLEELLVVLASLFFVIVSLEENRRLNQNLLLAQLSTLENAVARVSSESEAKNDFIAVLAHELRNPLAPVVSSIDFLKLKHAADADDSETLTMMEDRLYTVKRLLDDLLDISRISEGKLTLRQEKVDLAVVAEHAILSTRHLIKERHQAFTFKESKEPLIVTGDPVRIEQAFSNLITNASKYSDSGDQIVFSLSRENDFAKIVVQDTGIGIAPESLQHIFLPFHQVELGARTRKGLGIGLALVRNFVELHGGSVAVESKGVGKGSTFTIMLPLASS